MSRNVALVPAFNEAEAIGATVEAIRAAAPSFDVLVIDDGSADETRERARGAGAAVLPLPFNVGIGGAMQAGYVYAEENGYEVAVQVDGDGQHDPRHIADLLACLEADPDLNLVTGSRFLGADPDGFRSSPTRRVGIRIFASILSLVTHQRVTDPTSGFRLTDRRAIELFANDYPCDYPEVEAIVLVHTHRLRSREVPVVMAPRRTGVSAITSYESVYYMTKVLLAVFVALVRERPVRAAADVAAEAGS